MQELQELGYKSFQIGRSYILLWWQRGLWHALSHIVAFSLLR